MPILHDATTTPAARVNAGTTMTQAHTCTGADRFLTVNVGHNTTMSWVTYGGVAMTQIGTTSTDGAANSTTTFWLINPLTGANNVVITVATSWVIMCHIVSHTWVIQSGFPDAVVTNWPTTTTSWTQTLTTVANNTWLIMCAKWRSGNAITAGANTFIRANIELLYTGLFIADSNSDQTPAGSKSMNVTSASQEFNGTMFSLAPSVTLNNSTILLMGI